MAADTNVVVLVGRLTRDPEVRVAGSGSSVANLRLAVTSRGKDEAGEWTDRPNYFDVTVFGRLADNADKYLTKGSRVAVTGRLEWREWEGKDGGKRQAVQVVASDVQYLTAMGERDAGGGSDLPTAATPAASSPADSDIPF